PGCGGAYGAGWQRCFPVFCPVVVPALQYSSAFCPIFPFGMPVSVLPAWSALRSSVLPVQAAPLVLPPLVLPVLAAPLVLPPSVLPVQAAPSVLPPSVPPVQAAPRSSVRPVLLEQLSLAAR